MEPHVFKADYSLQGRPESEKESQNGNIIDYMMELGLFKAYEEAFLAIPHIIDFRKKAAYEYILFELNKFTKKWNGKITGVIDYNKHQADISIVLPFFEFSDKEDLQLLKKVSEEAEYVDFSSDAGKIKLYVLIEYFTPIEDTSHLIEKTILADEEFVEFLAEQEDQESDE